MRVHVIGMILIFGPDKQCLTNSLSPHSSFLQILFIFLKRKENDDLFVRRKRKCTVANDFDGLRFSLLSRTQSDVCDWESDEFYAAEELEKLFAYFL